MSDEVIQLRGTDFDECMDFLNEVFSEHAPHDFAGMLPSIYQPTDEQMACNYAIRVDGKLAAVVGLFPAQWQVGDQVLKVGGIGGVSTHKRVRGAGYMKLGAYWLCRCAAPSNSNITGVIRNESHVGTCADDNLLLPVTRTSCSEIPFSRGATRIISKITGMTAEIIEDPTRTTYEFRIIIIS